jgi:hypothetical protein
LHNETQSKRRLENTIFSLKKRANLEQNNHAPFGQNDFPQAERDRVYEKYQMLLKRYGDPKAHELLSEREMLVLTNTVANQAADNYDEKLAQTALLKVRIALGAKPPSSEQELIRISSECLNQDEKAALIGYYTKKARNPAAISDFRDFTSRF